MELVITSHLEIIQLDNLVNLSLEKVPTNTTSAYCCYNIDDDKVIRHKYDGLSILYKLFILVSSTSLVFSSVDNLFETHLFYKRSKSIKSIAFCVIKNEKWFFIKSEHFNIQRTTHKYWAAPVCLDPLTAQSSKILRFMIQIYPEIFLKLNSHWTISIFHRPPMS